MSLFGAPSVVWATRSCLLSPGVSPRRWLSGCRSKKGTLHNPHFLRTPVMARRGRWALSAELWGQRQLARCTYGAERCGECFERSGLLLDH